MKRKRLNGLQLVHFQHPTDKALHNILVGAMAHLRPEAQSLIADYEAYLYARHISSSLLVSEQQLSDIYRLLRQACEILDVRPPLLFVQNDSAINAWTSGSRQTFVVVTSGLVEKVSEDELLAVIGHELGHVKGHHMYYHALAQNAQNILSAQSETASALEASGNWLLEGIGMWRSETIAGLSANLWSSLFEWSRVAEFTADRAALLVTQDLDVTINVMAKLASGLDRTFNQEAFLKQADSFRNFKGSSADYLRLMLVKQESHPLIVLRAEELRVWAFSSQYRDLANLEQDAPETRFVCASCGQTMVAPISLGGHVIQCPGCGKDTTVPGISAPPLITEPPRIGM